MGRLKPREGNDLPKDTQQVSGRSETRLWICCCPIYKQLSLCQLLVVNSKLYGTRGPWLLDCHNVWRHWLIREITAVKITWGWFRANGSLPLSIYAMTHVLYSFSEHIYWAPTMCPSFTRYCTSQPDKTWTLPSRCSQSSRKWEIPGKH